MVIKRPPRQICPKEKVDRIQKKLLLLGGMLELTCPPATIFRISNALQKSNKDLDMILLPGLAHTFSDYPIQRSWDFLVRHLRGEEPPREYALSGVFGKYGN